jgi:Zn-dependent protease
VTILGIPIKIEFSFFAVVAFLGMTRGANLELIAEWLAVASLSVLLHEFGHALAARAFGLSPQIRLYAMGGQTWWKSETNITPPGHLVISLAGPATGFLLGGVVFLAEPFVLSPTSSFLATSAYRDLLWVNIGWGLFNLLPMLPLDGGSVLLTLEQWILKRKDQLFSHALSFVSALAITCLALRARSLWIGFLGIWFAYINGSFLHGKLQTRLDQKLRPDLDQIRDELNRGETDHALDRISKLQKKAWAYATKREAAQLVIFAYLKQKKYDQATEELRRFMVVFGEDTYLQGAVHFFKEELTSALPYVKAAFDHSPDKQLGLMLNQCLIGTGDFEGALELRTHPAMEEVKWELAVNLQSDAFNAGQFEMSVKAGLLAYEQKADPNVAFNLACAFSRIDHLAEALDWVARAIEVGFDNAEALLSDPDLDAVRQLPEFSQIVARMPGKPATA